MTSDDRISERLTAGLTDLAGSGTPDYRNDILQQVARTRQRPAWTFPERWIPMTLLTHREAPPRLWAPARPLRQTWLLLAAAALAIALIAGLAIGAARLLGPQDSDHLGMVSVPTFTQLDSWDASTIDGLEHVSDIEIGPDGNLYVVNGTNEILVIDPHGKVVDRWGSLGTGPGQFSFRWDAADPTTTTGGVAVGADGTVYVADLNNRRVQQFAPGATSKRDVVGEWGQFGTADGQFLRPYEISVDRTGRVYVADVGRSDIQRFSATGTFIDRTGGPGSGAGQFSDIAGMSVAPDGTLLVTDFTPGRVDAWGQDLQLDWTLPATAQDVAADAAGNLYLTDSAGLTVLGPDHAKVASWTAPAADPSAFDWRQIALSPDGTAYVSSQNESRIYRLAITSQMVEVSPGPSVVTSPLPSAPAGVDMPSSTPRTLLTVGAPFAKPFTLEVPPGWSLGEVWRGGAQVSYANGTEGTPAWIEVHIPTNVYLDPCHTKGGPASPPVSLTVDGLTEALTHLIGYRVGPITDVEIGGYRGKVFELDGAVDMTTCDDTTWLPQWTFDGSRSGASYDIDNGDLPNAHQRIAVLDVDGTTVLVWTFFPDLRSDWVQAANQVMESIDFH